ncbi:MAG TPA: winged helix-turn-helix domain-containing protein [Candidatus Binatia bacterium]|nr:winged helix-turn-helix domain-containing protein [Candidatus Binatia bacterium]
MLYRFDPYELDTAAMELRIDGVMRPLEPQVFRLLALLIEHRERVVSKDEIIEKVWDGRAVSDAALSSRIKSARKALDDDGTAQRFIKTVHGQGFRFVASARAERSVATMALPEQEAAPQQQAQASRPSIAVLPFRFIGSPGAYPAIAQALPQELIGELSRMRWLFVIARESSFRLHGDEDIGEIRRLLGARYCLSGTIEIAGRGLRIAVQLVDTRDAGVVWAEEFAASVDDVHEVRAGICSKIVAALELRIPLHEAGLARMSVTENLDAWLAYHLGLQHMYRFNHRDNDAAAALFTHALSKDPHLARAHAGLSFVHFQSAFLRHSDDIAGEHHLARQHAERGLELDPMDPFVNCTMGRTCWLEGDLDGSQGWLDRAISISPNYAHGIYVRALTQALAGQGSEGVRNAQLAMSLSPLDPLYYAMLGSTALAYIADGEDAEAAVWAERAARAPGAHVIIAMIATSAHALAGNEQKALYWANNVRERRGVLVREDFFRDFPMKDAAMKARVSKVLARFGF